MGSINVTFKLFGSLRKYVVDYDADEVSIFTQVSGG
jgi:hypothetical protein